MMEITSLQFFALAAVSVMVYWKLPKRSQWIVLLVDSLVFYFANASVGTFLYVCVSVTSVYGATRYFSRVKTETGKNTEKHSRTVLILTLVLNIGILAVLKYTNLAIHTLNFFSSRILHVEGISDVTWLAPLAVSFYTLQLVSYLLDCYWGVAEPFLNPLHLGLYTIYFPLMTSGPICRFSQLGKQLFEEHRFDYDRVKFGLYRIAWGMMKKCAISNRMAVIVDQMWGGVPLSLATGINIWLMTALFIVQLYTDFSGCMDIALGVSACFGVMLPENFEAPQYARSVQEFWRRWHITLGQFLRDYIMNPLMKSPALIELGKRCRKRFGKQQGKKIPSYVAMLAVWLCMGLWHGNSWKFIIGEGLWFWTVIVIGQVCEPFSKRAKTALHIKTDHLLWHAFENIRTMALYVFGMVFFRADSLMDALSRISAGFHNLFNIRLVLDMVDALKFADMGGKEGVVVMTIAFVAMMVIDYLKYKGVPVKEKISSLKWRWVLYYALVIIIYMSLNIASQESIYAQF